MNPQEAQQAQTIEDIKRNHRTEKGLNKLTQAHYDRAFLIGLVDSQAQKISALNDMVEADHRVMAEQAKEIEKLKSNYSAMVQTNRQRG